MKQSPETARLGLPDTVSLVIGASDGCLANLGAGAIKRGTTTLTIGTSGAIRQTVRKPLRDDHGRLFCYILDKDQYVVGRADQQRRQRAGVAQREPDQSGR